MANEHVTVDCGTKAVTFRDDTQAEKDERVVAQAAQVIADKATADAEVVRLALVEAGDAKLRAAGLTQHEIDARRERK